MAEVRVHEIAARHVGDGEVREVLPRPDLRDHALLVLRGIHVALDADHQLRALHDGVADDLGVVAVVTDDRPDLQALGSVDHHGFVTRVPRLHRDPRQDLVVVEHDLALVVDEEERVERCPLRVVLAGDREHAPDFVLATRVREDRRLRARHRCRQILPLGGVEALGRVLRKDHEVESRIAALAALYVLRDLPTVVEHLLLGLHDRDFVVDHRHSHGVLRG